MWAESEEKWAKDEGKSAGLKTAKQEQRILHSDEMQE